MPLVFVLNHHIHFFVVETAQAGDCSTFDGWSSIEPHDIFVGLAINNYVIVLSLTLVRTLRCCLARPQQGIVDGGQWYVIADWKTGFVELHARVAFCDCGAFERDFHAARRV